MVERLALLLPRVGLGVLIGGSPVELLALGVGQDVAVAPEKLQIHPGPAPVGAPGRVEESVADGEGQGEACPGRLRGSAGGVGLELPRASFRCTREVLGIRNERARRQC